MDVVNATPYVPPSVIWMWLFPVTYLIHLAEEFWGGEGYSAYLYRLRGVHLSPTRFLIFQSLGLILLTVGVVLSRQFKWPRFMLALMGALVLANGLTHTITAIRDRGYGPGLVTCVLVWIPLGLVTLFKMPAQMQTSRYVIAVSIGFAIQGVV